MYLVGQEVDGVLALDEGGVGAASNEALDGHLDGLAVLEPVALKVNYNRADGLA